jgi:hypothetical protein
MTDRSKFEEMLERLINEDREGAEELFHEIVVEKSREIYQSIIESEDEEVDEAEDEEVDESEDELEESADEDDDLEESEDEEDDDLDEMFGLDEFELEADPMAAMGGDATDDMMGDMGMGDDNDDHHADVGGDEELEDRLMDLEDALEELKAEFEAMMGDEGDEDDEDDMDMDDEGDEDDMDMDDEGDDEKAKEAFAFEAKKADKKDEKKDDKKDKKSAAEEMREFVEKVAPAKMGDNGANAKSIVAGKNDMGGTTANILRTDTENSGEANKGQLKGSSLIKQKPQDMKTGNVNVPGGKASKSMKTMPAGHGAEKKGKPETADKSAGSMLNGAPKRAK